MSRTRSEVPVEETWRLEDIFPDPAAWEAALQAVEPALAAVTRYRGRTGESAATLLACLDARERLLEQFMPVVDYAVLQLAADGTAADRQAAMRRVQALNAHVMAETSFIVSELLQLPGGLLERYLAGEPGLAVHRPFLNEVLEFRPHALAPEAEVALAALSEALNVPYAVYSAATGADIRFDPVTDSAGRAHSLSLMGYFLHMEVSPDTDLRRRAYAALVRGLKPYEHSLATTLGANIRRNVVLAQVRRYGSTFEMLLHDMPQPTTVSDQIPVQVFENILDVIQAELAPHMQRYARLRRQVLGLDRLMLCDVKAPLDAEYDPQITFDQAARWIEGSVAVLGPEYTETIRRAFAERWIDRADNLGRMGAAFCRPVYGVHPYVFSSWTGSLQSAFTLAHELGHAVHMHLATHAQSLTNSRYDNFFVEAPSTLGELLLARHIRETTDDPRLHRLVTMRLLNTYHHNFITHLLEAELLRRLYRMAEAGQPITADVLGREKAAVLARFWGDTVELDEGARLAWMRQPHYYDGIYPYSYSAGLAAATLFSGMLRDEGEPAARRWLQALKAGSTVKPLDLFRMVGIDMSGPAPLRQAVASVGSMIDEVESSFA